MKLTLLIDFSRLPSSDLLGFDCTIKTHICRRSGSSYHSFVNNKLATKINVIWKIEVLDTVWLYNPSNSQMFPGVLATTTGTLKPAWTLTTGPTWPVGPSWTRPPSVRWTARMSVRLCSPTPSRSFGSEYFTNLSIFYSEEKFRKVW